MARFTITLNDETTAKLDDLVGRLGQPRATLAEMGISLLIDTLAKADGSKLVQIAPTAGADCTSPTQPVQPPKVRDPLEGAKPGDSDEILALIRSVNAMPRSTELSGDLAIVNAARRADLLHQIADLRAQKAV